jgi:hypothetical protein
MYSLSMKQFQRNASAASGTKNHEAFIRRIHEHPSQVLQVAQQVAAQLAIYELKKRNSIARLPGTDLTNPMGRKNNYVHVGYNHKAHEKAKLAAAKKNGLEPKTPEDVRKEMEAFQAAQFSKEMGEEA